MNTIPEFLSITNVETEVHLGAIGSGGFGHVFRGTYKEQQVALKVVNKGRHDVSTLPFSPNNTADANSFWQGFFEKRFFAGSHSMAIPLTPSYPSSLGNICRGITTIPGVTIHESRTVNSVEKRAGAGCN